MYIVRFPYNTKDKVHYASFYKRPSRKGELKKIHFYRDGGWGWGGIGVMIIIIKKRKLIK